MLNKIYLFLTGPGAWISLSLFLSGIIIKLSLLLHLTLKKEPQVLTFLNLKLSIYSVFRWFIPFATISSRTNPFTTLLNSIFHGLFFLTPLLAMGHSVMIKRAFGIDWPSLPDRLVDLMTLLFIFCCILMVIRRIVKKEVLFVTSFSDWLILILASLPFITGFLAYHQLFHYQIIMILHILSAEILLIMIPVTRLSHMFYAVLLRAYTASEFRAVRHARDC